MKIPKKFPKREKVKKIIEDLDESMGTICYFFHIHEDLKEKEITNEHFKDLNRMAKKLEKIADKVREKY